MLDLLEFVCSFVICVIVILVLKPFQVMLNNSVHSKFADVRICIFENLHGCYRIKACFSLPSFTARAQSHSFLLLIE